jgi:hypothetical protein
MRSRLLIPLVLASVLVLGACGSDGGEEGLDEDEQAYADAWSATLADGDEDDIQLTDGEADCMGDAVMAELGVEPFEEAGVEADEINQDGDDDDSPGEVLGDGVVSEDQANAVLDVWEGCADLPDAFAGSVATEFDLDDEGRACVTEGLEEQDLVRKGFLTSFTTDDDTPSDDVVEALIDLVGECGGSTATDDQLVESIASSLSEDGSLDQDDATCIAEQVVDDIGADRLIELTGAGDFADAPPEVQAEIGAALSTAAGACGVPLDALGG